MIVELLGLPGIGKTTLCRQLSMALLGNDNIGSLSQSRSFRVLASFMELPAAYRLWRAGPVMPSLLYIKRLAILLESLGSYKSGDSYGPLLHIRDEGAVQKSLSLVMRWPRSTRDVPVMVAQQALEYGGVRFIYVKGSAKKAKGQILARSGVTGSAIDTWSDDQIDVALRECERALDQVVALLSDSGVLLTVDVDADALTQIDQTKKWLGDLC